MRFHLGDSIAKPVMQIFGSQTKLVHFKSFFYKWAIPDKKFFIFFFSTVTSKYVRYKILPMPGFERRTSAIVSNHCAN